MAEYLHRFNGSTCRGISIHTKKSLKDLSNVNLENAGSAELAKFEEVFSILQFLL